MGTQSSKDLSNNGFKYSVPVSLSNLHETPVMRYPDYADGLINSYSPKIKTVQDVLLASATSFADNKCLGKRDPNDQQYTWWTYKQVLKMSERIGSAILEQELFNKTGEIEGEQFETIAILGKNSVEWGLLEWASSLYNFTIVGLIASTAAQVIEECNLTTVFCSSEHLDLLRGFSSITKIVLMNQLVEQPSDDSDSDAQNSESSNILFFKDILTQQEAILPYKKVKPENVCSIIYTSGTTTNSPKGGMITHANCIASLTHLQLNAQKKKGGFFIKETDVYYSALPLSHVYERDSCLKIIAAGACIGYASKDISSQRDDLAILQPTIYCSVPRLYNRVYQSIKDQLSSLDSSLYKKFLEYVLQYKEGSEHVKSPIVDSLLLKKFKNTFGGRVRILFSGGAPLNHKVIDFLQAVLCVPILQGYGQTESNGVAFCLRVGGGSHVSVGGPECNTEFKLLNCSDHGYSTGHLDGQGALMPRGEILLRGGKIFKGYFKNPELTASKIDEDGWLHTGDIGQILPNGALEILDRRNNIFKLPIGEFVAPEKIEGIYLLQECIQEIFVYGASDKNNLVAIVVPNFETIVTTREPEANQNESQEELEERIQEKVKSFIQSIESNGKHSEEMSIVKYRISQAFQDAESDLLSYEKVQEYEVIIQPFASVGLLTSTGKLRRKKAAEYFNSTIQNMYSKYQFL